MQRLESVRKTALLTGISALFMVFIASYAPPRIEAHTHRAVLYLTFDDGPSERYTPLILDILRKENVKATFFVLGFRCQQFPRIARTIHQGGHEIGSHGYHHDFIVHKSAAWVQQDIRKSDAAIKSVCGVSPLYYRPPGGLLRPTDVSSIRRLGHPIALWTVDSMDWKASSSDEIVRNVVGHAHPGSVILLHDGVSGSRYTVRALPTLIHELKAKGYQFSTLPLTRGRLAATANQWHR